MIELLVLIAGIASLMVLWKSKNDISDAFKSKAVEYKLKVIKSSSEEIAKTEINKETTDKVIAVLNAMDEITKRLNK